MESRPNLNVVLADYADANWLRDTSLKRRLRELQKDSRVDLTLFGVGDGMTCAVKR